MPLDNAPAIGQYINTEGALVFQKIDHSLKSDGCKLDAIVSQN